MTPSVEARAKAMGLHLETLWVLELVGLSKAYWHGFCERGVVVLRDPTKRADLPAPR